MVNKVCFEYLDGLRAGDISKFPRFSDGIALELTALVVDQNGNLFHLNEIENSVQGYLCIRPEGRDWLKISETDLVFTKLQVQSNRPVHFSRIEWVEYDIWDL